MTLPAAASLVPFRATSRPASCRRSKERWRPRSSKTLGDKYKLTDDDVANAASLNDDDLHKARERAETAIHLMEQSMNYLAESGRLMGQVNAAAVKALDSGKS